MAVKKGALDNFLNPSSHYNDNQKTFRSIFIDNENDLNPDFQDIPASSFEEAYISNQLVTNKESISNPAIKEKVTQKINKEPISNPISNHNKEPISNQLVTQLVTKNPDVSLLSGLQKKILFRIVEDCIYKGQLTSGFITNETFRELTKSNANTVKTAVQRLINKGFIKRNPDKNGKRGKGGFSSFIITEEIRNGVIKEKRDHVISNQLVTQLVTHNSNQLVTNKESNKESTASSSSSLNINTTTNQLEDEWNFDITPYAKFGFRKTQIKQLTNCNVMSASGVEQSLIEFSYDFDNNALPLIKTTPINLLMGLLREGNSYTSTGFRSELEAVTSEIAIREEDKRKKLLEEKFSAWEGTLNDGERKEIENKLPTHLMVSYRALGISDPEVRKWVSEYFLRFNRHNE